MRIFKGYHVGNRSPRKPVATGSCNRFFHFRRGCNRNRKIGPNWSSSVWFRSLFRLHRPDLHTLLTADRSEQLLEDEGTSVAPPQHLRSHIAISQTQPLPGSSQQRVENRTNVDNDIESDDESGSNETNAQSSSKGNSEDGKASKGGNANSDDGKASKDGNRNGKDSKASKDSSVDGYVFPLSCPLEGFFFLVFVCYTTTCTPLRGVFY